MCADLPEMCIERYQYITYEGGIKVCSLCVSACDDDEEDA